MYWIVGYGLGGSFGGIQNYEVVDVKDEQEAIDEAYQKACDYYDSYAGDSDLRDINAIMEEEEIDDEEIACDIFCEEREDWLEYEALKFTVENIEKVQGYHFDNPYKDRMTKEMVDQLIDVYVTKKRK